MASTNALLNPSVICKEIAYQVRNNMKFAASVYRAPEEDFAMNPGGWKVGQFVDVRLPTKYTAGTTASVASGQDFINTKKRLTANQIRNVVLEFTSEQLTWGLSRFSEEVIQPAALVLANSIDAYMANLARTQIAQTYQSTLGTVNGLGHIYGARQYLINSGAPAAGNYLAVHPNHVASLMPVLGTLFNNTYTDPLLKDGVFGNTAGCTVWESQNLESQQYGTISAGTAVIDTAAWTFATAPTSGTIALGTIQLSGTGTLYPGQVFTQASVYACKPLTGGAGAQSTGQLKQFVFAGTGAAGTAATLTSATAVCLVYDGPIGNGPYQNVTTATGGTMASVAASQVITLTATAAASYPMSLMYNPNFAALAVVPLALPDGAAWKARESVDGISVRLLKDYNGLSDIEVCRADVLFGGAIINPGLACRIT